MQSVVAAFFETQKKLARSTRRARRFLKGMSLPNPKNDNKGQAICILNPDGIPSHSPGLRSQPRVPDIINPSNPDGCGMNTGRLAAYEIRLFSNVV
jgi:hypothetical protein